MGCTSSSNTITVRYNNQSKCVEIDGLKTVADLKKVLASTYRIDSVDIKFQDNTLDPEMALAKAGVKAKSEVFAITNLNLGPANAGAGDPSQAQASSASVNCLDPSGNIESINFDWMNATVAEVKKIYSERTRIPMDSINFSFKNESMDNSKTMKECGVALGDNNQVIVKIN